MPGRVPILDQLPVAIEHDYVARRQHVLSWVGKVANRPQHVKRRGGEDDPDRGCHPGPLGPQPHEWPRPGHLRAATGGLRNHPTLLLQAPSCARSIPALERFEEGNAG
jgi:hypothetical protein